MNDTDQDMRYDVFADDGPNHKAARRWHVCRLGVIGAWGRARIVSFPEEALARQVSDALNAGEMDERQARAAAVRSRHGPARPTPDGLAPDDDPCP